jgi:hypothetical protein
MCAVQARLPFGGVKISGGRVKLGRIDGQEESATARRPIVYPRPALFVRLFPILCGDLAGYQSNRRSNIPSQHLSTSYRKNLPRI